MSSDLRTVKVLAVVIPVKNCIMSMTAICWMAVINYLCRARGWEKDTQF